MLVRYLHTARIEKGPGRVAQLHMIRIRLPAILIGSHVSVYSAR